MSLAAAAVVGTEAEQEAAGLGVVTEASGLVEDLEVLGSEAAVAEEEMVEESVVGGSEADPEAKDLAEGKAAAG